ncbi:MAG: hypothetical protein IK092_07545 [Muribaculaceae bacterium]|nr:hypothetical protein [Muribaculaceae bacterium]
MAFIKNLKRAFGFVDDEDADVIDGNAAIASTSRREKNSASAPVTHQPTQHTKADSDFPQILLDRLIEVVNGSLPPFVAQSIDVEAEKAELSKDLGPKFKETVKEIRDEALGKATAKWNEERAQLLDKNRAQNEVAAQLKQRLDEAKEKHQATEAQRKMLNARLNDMQMKIANLEAEREQFDLENKSLLNKIKVMQVKGEMVAGDQANASANDEELKELKLTVERLREKAKNDALLIAKLQKGEAAPAQSPDVEQLTQEFNSKMEVTNKLLTEFRNDVASKKKDIEILEAKIASQQQEINSLSEQLNDAKEELKIADEIQEQLKLVEDFKERKDAEIRELKDRVAAYEQNKNVSADEAQGKLQEALEANAKLKREIEHLNKQAAEDAKKRNKRDIDLANQINILKDKLKAAAEQHTAIVAERENVQKALDEAEKRIAELEEQLAEMQNVAQSEPVVDPEPQPEAVVAPEPVDEPQPDPEPQPALVVEAKPQPAQADELMPDDLDDIDWLVPTPKTEEAPKPQEKKVEPKPAPEPQQPSEPQQMSLF